MKKNSSTSEQNTEPKEISRRDFLYGAAASGVVALQSCSNGSSKDCSCDEDGRAQEVGDWELGPVIDVHRHCMWKDETPEENAIREVFKSQFDWQELPSGGYTVTADGITVIANPELSDIDIQVQKQDDSGITLGILSFSMHLEMICRALGDTVPSDDLNRTINDRIFEMVEAHPSKLAFLAMVNPFSENSVDECQRCIDKLGAKGISIGTSWDGEFLSSVELDGLWEYAQENDLAVFLHPPLVPVNHEKINAYRLEEVVARPSETTLSIAHMIYSGVFDRHPDLKIVLPHMGGTLPSVIGRLDFGYRLGYKGLPNDQAALCKNKPSDYLKTNLYVDIMGFSPSGIRQCIELFGTDRILFGTDYAAVDISPSEHIEIVRKLGLSQDEESKIFWKNANELFKVL